MPYYKDLNLLFIHIPKTGGSFIADALNNKNYKVTLSQRGISIHNISNSLFEPPHNKGSLQHQFYSTLYKYKNKINIDFEKTKVFSVVRNPYNKIMSDLFWLKLINKKSSPNEIYEKIKNNYLYRDDLDNHNQPQCRTPRTSASGTRQYQSTLESTCSLGSFSARPGRPRLRRQG